MQDETPSRHHYELAHVALRSLAFHDPIFFFGIMGSEKGKDLLSSIWEEVCQVCGDDAPFAIEEVALYPTKVGPYPTLLIEMPPPQQITEAHFIGVVLKANPEKEFPDEPEIAYYTLEFSRDIFEGTEKTVLCGWNKEGTHLNFGEGPDPTIRDFLSTLQDKLLPN